MQKEVCVYIGLYSVLRSGDCHKTINKGVMLSADLREGGNYVRMFCVADLLVMLGKMLCWKEVSCKREPKMFLLL